VSHLLVLPIATLETAAGRSTTERASAKPPDIGSIAAAIDGLSGTLARNVPGRGSGDE
jgi:hypothetical protein